MTSSVSCAARRPTLRAKSNRHRPKAFGISKLSDGLGGERQRILTDAALPFVHGKDNLPHRTRLSFALLALRQFVRKSLNPGRTLPTIERRELPSVESLVLLVL